jgi:hypothetical protein
MPTDQTKPRSDEEKTARIRALNDQFRRTFRGGRVMMTQGVAALPVPLQAELLSAIRAFDDFTADNDPWAEHDMASVTIGEMRFFWKIDYYDQSLLSHSEDPANACITQRVLTIMLVEEY